MPSSSPTTPIKALAYLPRGGPVDTACLRQIGVSPALASHYVRSGWLTRLGRGVFMFPEDELKVAPTLALLARHVPGLHVGGKTALAWRGIRHNVGPREKLTLWGHDSRPLPSWFGQRFPSRYVARKLFDAQLAVDFGLQPLPETPQGPLVSVPERALLEMLSEVATPQQGLEEARNIMEAVRSPRLDVLQTLLQHCPSVKVVRLCVQWAEELGLKWATEARRFAGPRGRGRWLTRLPDGKTLVLKP
jgi:hypothetical protein